MNPFGRLSEENDDQMRKYLKFFRQKKDGIIRSINREFIDIKDDKLDEEVYTKDDVSEYTDFLATAIKVKNNFLEVIIHNQRAIIFSHLHIRLKLAQKSEL